jgi:predicted nuclease with TOPRIM domain
MAEEQDIKPRYVELLERTLAHVTAARDEAVERLEKRGRLVEELTERVESLEREQEALNRQCREFQRKGADEHARVVSLEAQLLTDIELRQLVSKARHTTQVLSTILAEEREAKRARHAV